MKPLNAAAVFRQLSTLDQCTFSGKVPERLRQLEKHTGLPWEKIIETLAREGYAWNDAAELIDVNRRALIQYTRMCGLMFPWQGVRSPVWRNQHSRAMKGQNRICARNLKQYTAFGVTDSLPNLVRRFAPPALAYNCVLMRLNRNWDLERALVVKPKPRSDNRPPRNPNAANNWKQPYDSTATHPGL